MGDMPTNRLLRDTRTYRFPAHASRAEGPLRVIYPPLASRWVDSDRHSCAEILMYGVGPVRDGKTNGHYGVGSIEAS